MMSLFPSPIPSEAYQKQIRLWSENLLFSDHLFCNFAYSFYVHELWNNILWYPK